MPSRQGNKALDVGSSCFVFASAGSGKTTVLVNRYVKSLFLGVEPKDILCITYSNDAVREIEQRVSNKLRVLYINNENSTEIYLKETLEIPYVSEKDIEKASELFFKFQDNLSQLKILTIHSFCQSLLMQFPLEAGIFPNFTVLEDVDAKKLLQQAKNTCLTTIPEEVVRKLSEDITLSTFEELINKIYQHLPDFMEFFDKNKNLQEYDEKASNFLKITKDISQNFTQTQQKFIKKFLKNKSLEEAYLTKDGALRKRIPYPNDIISQQIATIVYENYANKNKLRTLEKTCAYLQLAKQIIDEYQRLKAERNALNFFDVLYKTKYLVTESYAKEFIISKICSQIKSIMIDEAQDLSPLQWELMRIFADDIFSDPHSRKTIFVVGDIKQSIYRFQGADCDLFAKFYDDVAETFRKFNKNLEIVALDKNYRSRPKILEAVDKVFEGEISKNLGSNSIKYRRHIPFRKDEPGVVEIISNNDKDDAGANEGEEKTQRKAQIIAAHIANLKSNNSLILTRNRDNLSESIINNLINLGVEIAPPDRITLNNNSLIMDFLAVIDICIDITNDYALYTVLKSPYILEQPLSNEDLYKVCHNRVCPVFENLRIQFPEQYEYFDTLISRYNENELRKICYLLTINLHNISSNEEYILDSFMDEVTKFSNNISENIPEFLEYFRTSDIEIKNQNSSQKSMRLSTIHGSKGLEADTVFLLDFKLSADKAKTTFLFSDDYFFIKPPQKKSFPEIEQLATQEYEAETRELYRLLYVAMTRARNNLYIFSDAVTNTEQNVVTNVVAGVTANAAANAKTNSATGSKTAGALIELKCCFANSQ